MPETPWRHLIVGLGYPIGFVIVVPGRMQFFTKSTITAMLPLVTRPSWSMAGRTARLRVLVLLGNLVGMAITTLGFASLPLVDPSLRHGMVAISEVILEHDSVTIFCTAIPAGFMIAGPACSRCWRTGRFARK